VSVKPPSCDHGCQRKMPSGSMRHTKPVVTPMVEMQSCVGDPFVRARRGCAWSTRATNGQYSGFPGLTVEKPEFWGLGIVDNAFATVKIGSRQCCDWCEVRVWDTVSADTERLPTIDIT
jgi:hypothetical protein